jgi:hypothetical protein
MEHSQPTPTRSESERPALRPVQVGWYGFICFLGQLIALSVLVLLTMLGGVKPHTGINVIGLFISIHFANWRFIRTYRREFLSTELNWFAFSCFVAFWVCDEPLGLVATVRSNEWGYLRKAVEIVAASTVDFAVVAAIVYLTVPWASKRLLRPAAA